MRVGILLAITLLTALGGCQPEQAKIWTNPTLPNSGLGSFFYPESEDPAVKARADVGFTLVGGGNRAYTSGTGFLRGLHKLGLIDNARYLSCISGGSWAGASFTFRQVTPDDDEFLGTYHPPEKLTMALLNTMPAEGTMDYAIPAFTARHAANNLTPEEIVATTLSEVTKAIPIIASGNYSLEELETAWIKFVYSVYLKPLGVPEDKFMSLSIADVNHIVSQNPNTLSASDFVVPAKEYPYFIAGGTILGSQNLAPLVNFREQNSATRLEQTPLYAGAPYNMDVTYKSQRSGDVTRKTGGLIQSFGFGARVAAPHRVSASSTIAQEDTVPITRGLNNTRYGIEDAIGISSFFVGGIYASLSEYTANTSVIAKMGFPQLVDDIGATGNPYFPFYNTVPTFETSALYGNEPSQPTMLADGGILDNSGIFALLRRKVKKITVFDCSEETLQKNTNLNALFGVSSHDLNNLNLGTAHSNNMVFAIADYIKIKQALQAKIDQGNTAVITMDLSTVKNDWWGIPAGQTVTLTWAYVTKTSAWVNKLPLETQAALNTPDTFPNFPHYSTTKNFLLNAPQVNLLSQYTTYMVMENAELFNAAFDAGQSKVTTTAMPQVDGPSSTIGSTGLIAAGILLAFLVLAAMISYGLQPRS